MTERLYYDDAYLREFDAKVVDCEPDGDAWLVRLDRSAFYPTSGGQPHDEGTLGGARVLDVEVEEGGDVVHRMDAPLEIGTTVHGEIDWPRRFDHMQQHAADHMIASALWRHFGGVTIGLHVSASVSTIDVDMPGGATHLTAEQLRVIERDVNERVQRDVPIRCWFPEPDELASLPLRKPPTVQSHVRVVAIGDDEMVACGGTHPSSAGQLGLVKLLGAAPARGKMRLSFIAGMRAFGDYQSKFDIAAETSNLLSTAVENLPAHVAQLQASLKQAEYELSHLRLKNLLEGLESELNAALRREDGARVVSMLVDGDAALIREAASKVIRSPGVVALLGARTGEGRAAFVFARSQDVDLHMGRLLGEAARQYGGKGGGRPDFAQGGGDEAILDAARKLLIPESDQ